MHASEHFSPGYFSRTNGLLFFQEPGSQYIFRCSDNTVLTGNMDSQTGA